MTHDDLRALHALLFSDVSPDDVLDGLLPHVREYRELAESLHALPPGEVPNALVLAAGRRTRGTGTRS